MGEEKERMGDGVDECVTQRQQNLDKSGHSMLDLSCCENWSSFNFYLRIKFIFVLKKYFAGFVEVFFSRNVFP